MPEASASVREISRLLNISEDEVGRLADAEGRVPLETLQGRAGAAVFALELARAREEVGRLSGRLAEVRATNARLQGELRQSAEERRRLVEEVLELRAAAEERLMLMERIDHIARVEQELEERSSELERLKNRSLLERILNR